MNRKRPEDMDFSEKMISAGVNMMVATLMIPIIIVLLVIVWAAISS